MSGVYNKSEIPEDLQKYFVRAEVGLEPTPEAYVAKLVEVFREVRRVLADDGTLWLNLGSSYAGGVPGSGGKTSKQLTNAGSFFGSDSDRPVTTSASASGFKPKDLIPIPWMVAMALQQDGWWLRQDIIWCLSGGARVYARTQKGEMPMSVKDLVRLDPSTVQLWNGEKWTQVLGWNRSTAPRDEALEIELASGERIGCTPGHVWPTDRGNLRADQIQHGDVIRTTLLPEPETKYAPSFIDGSVAWLLGLYLAEGSQDERVRLQFAGHSAQTESRLAILGPVAESLGGTVRAYRDGENGACIVVDCPALAAIVEQYVHGRNAKRKGIKVRAWRHGNEWLIRLLQGYLEGDGNYDAENDRWRLGFTRNDRLASDLRTLAARIGATITLKATTGTGFGRKWPIYRGEIRLHRSGHHNERERSVVVSVRKSKARQHWDIGVADEPNLFALASGVLTHNSKPNPMPESVTDRPTKAHEYLFLLSKSASYFYDHEAIKEPGTMKPQNCFTNGTGPKSEGYALHRRAPGMTSCDTRNRRSVWTITTQPFSAWGETFRQVRVERDAADDGKRRITSPSCMDHASPRLSGSNEICGVREAYESSRSGRRSACPAPILAACSAPTHQIHELLSALHSSGSMAHECCSSATDHSSETHRTGRAPLTTLPCIVCAETADRIDDISGLPVCASHSRNGRRADNTPGDETPSPTSMDGTSQGSQGTSSCRCLWYVETRKETNHFAVMPEALVEPCVLAGSAKGDTVLDPFAGSGTVGVVALRHGRNFVGCELNPEYAAMAEARISRYWEKTTAKKAETNPDQEPLF